MVRILVLGGGFAGLSAGVSLAESGFCVQVLERRPFLGGRAYSFLDKKTGATVDNGQHLMMGCYRETFSFLQKIGSLDLLYFQKKSRVDFLEKNGQATLICPTLPAPLHLVVGLFRLQGLTWLDKLRVLNLRSSLNLKDSEIDKKFGTLTVDEWLTSLHQSKLIKKRFWDVLSIATLNEEPQKAAASLLIRVLQQAFCGTKRDSCVVTSRVGLSDLYTEQAKKFIETRNGNVKIQTTVKKILIENDRCQGIELTTGEIVEADFYLSSVPYFALCKILPDEVFETFSYFRNLKELHSSPIVSINLWFDRSVTDLSFAGLLDKRIQWLFNKNSILTRVSLSGQHLSLVISAAYDFQNLSKDSLVKIALEDLQSLLPAVRKAKLVHSFIVKEHDATLSTTVPAEKLRPSPQTPIKNFFLAGDWTNTGLPATIESAVLSGHRAASLIQQSKILD